MHRRDLIAGAGAALVATTGAVLAQQQQGHGLHHDHVGTSALAEKALACVGTGNACLDHCMKLLANGDTSIAACARSVDELVAACASLAKLATVGSAHLPAFAKATMAICQSCEAECRKHADKHATCKACGEACNACAAECRKVAA
jgi:Cys-rich four helix bundle protein (predicted Tat secretion target)